MALLAVGLVQEYRIAKVTVGMLRWLCFGGDVPLSLQSSNLALLRQMNGLDRLSSFLCPGTLEADEKSTSAGELSSVMHGCTTYAAYLHSISNFLIGETSALHACLWLWIHES